MKDKRTATIQTENGEIIAVCSINGVPVMRGRMGKVGVVTMDAVKKKLREMLYEVVEL
jgi:hypothetical protein